MTTPIPNALKTGLLADGTDGTFTVIAARPLECPACHVAHAIFVLRQVDGAWIYRCASACDR